MLLRRRTGVIVALVRWIALVGVLATLPGVAEAVEDTAHWVQSGHTVHDRSHAEGAADRDAEHGCSGMQHMCRCCPTALVLPIEAAAVCVSTTARPAPHIPGAHAWSGVEDRAPAFRPPIE